ncbi:MAG: class I SAM-dependent methyltransferase [Chloroflexi bacterium]|nr:class I SAM-dependent methyltransferase [Chloroflexota bacterium]
MTTSTPTSLRLPEFAGRASAWEVEAVTSAATYRAAQMGKVFGYLKGLHATHLIDIGVKLGLFQHLANSPAGLPAQALAAALALDPKYVRFWCETACALELLDYDPAAGFRLAPGMDEILGDPDGTYFVGLFPNVHLLLARDYERYPELFRTGGVFPYQEHDAPFFCSVACGTSTLPRMFMDAVLPKLPALQARLEKGGTVLDVGCGGGHALVAFAERFPNVACVGIDVEPTSVRAAQELIQARGLAHRVEARVVTGADWPTDLVQAFDLVTSFLVLHEIHPDLKSTVIGRCARAIRPGGQVLIFDECYPSSPSKLRDSAQIFAVMAQWYELTWGNVVNTREEIHALLSTQGLRIVDETSLSRFYIVTAEQDSTLVAPPGVAR